MIDCTCDFCGVPLKKYKSQMGKYSFCNHEHHYLWMKENSNGKNNSNYNHRWSNEQKEIQKNLVKSKVNDEYRRKCGTANKGKTFSLERRKNISKGKIGEYHPPHSKKTKKIIGEKSSKKFTPEFKINFRKTMEKHGHWIPLIQKSNYEIYFKESDWIEKMFDRCSNDEKLLLEKFRVFNCKTNTKGVVRDHVYSRRSGFNNDVFPELLRHPCNCEIILHSDNVAKKWRRYIDKDNISLNNLFEKIKCFKGNWKEQKICLKLIEEYTNGKRYKRKD